MARPLTDIYSTDTRALIYSMPPPAGRSEWPEIAAFIAETFGCQPNQVDTDPDDHRRIMANGRAVAFFN